MWCGKTAVINVRGNAWIIVLALLGPLLTACAASAPPAADAPPVPSATYVIGPGDTLSVFVYQAPDLSVTALPVRPDGRISVPLVPDIMAAGKTPTQLGDDIGKRLEKYVKDPSVTIIVRSFVGPFDRQIRVIGEATEPMAIPYRDHLTVLDVMIEAKGLTKYAAGNRALIVRHVDGQEKTIPVRLGDLLKDGEISQNVEMRPGDTLIIPQTWF